MKNGKQVILGVTHPISWNNGAAILVGGDLVAMVEEERLNRFKHSPRVPPLQSIRYCLETAGVTLDDVDFIGVGWDQGASRLSGLNGKRYHVSRHYIHQLPFPRDDKRVHFVNHHVSHALSSFYVSGFPEANLISLDASGGEESGLLGVGRGTQIEILEKIPNDGSWGVMYGTVTGKLGFTPHSDEGKVMGLAAYGTPDPDSVTFVDWDRPVPRIDRKRFKKWFASLKSRQPHEPLTDDHKNLAATLQNTLERAILQMGKYLHEKTGISAFCLGGGCALNCSANGKLLQQPFVKEIFVQPAAHDASTALGAALWVHAKITGNRPNTVMDHAYWGPQFSQEQIEERLSQSHLPYTKTENISKAAAELLADGKVVGWFQGRMEVGPRALGGRSILADPRTIEMKDRVNNRVKGRESWRPFAPSFLAEDFAPYVTKPYKSPFMILAFQGTDGKIGEIPAASHVDKTIRVQTVEKSANPRYWECISEFKKRTGVPAVLNTSFNVAGQPIVCSPFDAISTFAASGLDALAIGDYLLVKNGKL